MIAIQLAGVTYMPASAFLNMSLGEFEEWIISAQKAGEKDGS